jgi:hypothetical protein
LLPAPINSARAAGNFIKKPPRPISKTGQDSQSMTASSDIMTSSDNL